ncbi:hypothetical protein BJX76DRAFT_361429 [Aspergillus varians]
MATSPDLNPEDIFSDDSSFYGDEPETAPLEREAAEYDPVPYWTTTHPTLLSTIQNQERERAKQAQEQKMDSDFLKRLSPSTTKADCIGAWIYIHNPQAPHLKDDVPGFTRKGREALNEFETEEVRLRYENDRQGGSAIELARKVKPLERELEKHIFMLARETNCVTGKWMMFITADRVDSYWRAVADATMKGHLGIAAKVATNDGEGRTRLLAVYTRDYEDREDVKRVLRKLVELNLVKRGGRPIYYKRDALTYLDIMSKNRYGLKATAFSSADMLAGKF